MSTTFVDAQAAWLPLVRAVFYFGGAKDKFSAIDNNKKMVDFTSDELEEISKKSSRLQDLTELLREHSDAKAAYVNLNTLDFTFVFRIGHLERWISRNPWKLPDLRWGPSDPWYQGEALFNKSNEGPVWRSEDEMRRDREMHENCSSAAESAWTDMITEFGRSVASGEIVLFGRTPSLTSNFQKIPKDVCRILQINDWENGFAVAPDGTTYGVIHAQFINHFVEALPSVDAMSATKEPTKSELRDAYMRRRNNWPKSKPFPSETEDLVFLRQLRPSTTRDRARELRKELAPSSWKRKGRRKITS